MKTTVVVPLLNEAKSVVPLLDSLSMQTLLPTEVVLVDGGSTDATVTRILDWQKKHPAVSLRLIEKKGANRSVARNIGIVSANTSVVALTDGGCRPKVDWLEQITKPFVDDEKTEVVAGFYDPEAKNWIEEVLAEYTCVRKEDVDEKTFLPSSRSIALTKDIWQKVGGYPEELQTCEDLVFAQRLKAKTKHWKVNTKAQVIWDQPKNLTALKEKVFGYATGDLKAKYERHVKKIHAAKWRVLTVLFVGVTCLFVPNVYFQSAGLGVMGLYLLGSLGKHRRVLRYPLAWLMVPVCQFIVDLAMTQALIYHALSSRFD